MADDQATHLYNSGRQLLESGKIDEGIGDLEESVRLAPHFKALELLGEALLNKGQALQAIVPLAAATSLNDQVRAPALLAEAFASLGEELAAHRMAKVALGRDPKNRKAKAVFESTLAAYEKWSGEGQ